MEEDLLSPKAYNDAGQLPPELQGPINQALDELSTKPDQLTTVIPRKKHLLARRVVNPDAKELFPNPVPAEEPEDAPSDYIIVYRPLSEEEQKLHRARHLIIRILSENHFIKEYLQEVDG